ncbi:hypothetical protein G3O08_13965 [Cryomorpha ignava]|uniref:Outer membrane protein beta-barrel domain-containing protein n=1 Tax=Cryomorpha ignava TaxID=101383 RepID=A0A7K3WSE2_9FLAO|nr:BT1926 family outer membrane beta-barrel protein [Cryomorpha ignava]NEN24610.1 hypothetical protein [Cryomorpha ignava]
MKKVLIIAAAALFIGSAANAQDVMKQTGGEQNLEVLFAPLGGSPIGINGIKYRKFTSATTAIRATVFLGFNSTTDKTLGGGTDFEDELKTVNTSFDLSIRPGIEKHFLGTDRLSPYYGAEALIGFGTESTKDDQVYGAENEIETVKLSSQGMLTLGVNGIAGVDFYFADNIYLGAELGFGIQYEIQMEEKVESLNTSNGDINSGEVPGGSSFNVGPNVVGAIRLGFLF